MELPRKKGCGEGNKKATEEMAENATERVLKQGLSAEVIADILNLPVEQIQTIQDKIYQLERV